MTRNTEPTTTPRKKPRVALAIATALGVGYIPKAPGTFGSIVGAGITVLAFHLSGRLMSLPSFRNQRPPTMAFLVLPSIVLILVAAAGVWSASRVAAHSGIEDPQYVVIDEVSGQHLTLLLGGGLQALLNWKYLVLGFILFRVFDIWKPFPVRQAERLPGGWGIMADDWVAAIYAALGLWVARALGL
jgi:phosphatidylglycerophosphatase A